LDTSVMRQPAMQLRDGGLVQVAWATDASAPSPATAGDTSERQPEGQAGTPTTPPVVITIDETGRIIISSRDTRALDQLENLVTRLAPHKKNYEVFYLQNALASLVTLNLEEYFEEEANAEDDYWRGWYGFDLGQDKSKGEGLSKRRKIRFIYDYDTNSILVANASPDQLNTVRALIQIYDKPPSDDSISARRYQIFKLKHAQAEAVAETIKEVYRDLLSSKDKTFERNGGQKEQASQTTNYYRVYGSSDENKKPKKIRASFAGALSVGVDKVSNTVIVSAQEEWIPSISEMIEYLDVEAEPHKPTIEVVHTKIDAEILQSALAGTFGQQGKTTEPKKPPTEEKPPANSQQQEEQRQRQLISTGP
jgi:type II secretory pathway component GspD/PulD (secretin)